MRQTAALDAAGARAPRRHAPRRAAAATACAAALVLCLSVASSPAPAAPTTGRPLVATGGVKALHGNSVLLEGTVDARGLLTTYYFLYGPTEALGYESPSKTAPAENVRVKVGIEVTNFLPGYFYKLVAHNEAGYDNSRVKPHHYSKSRAPGVQVPKSLASISYGQSFTLAGKITGARVAGVPMQLQETAYPYLESFKDIGAPVLSGAGGEFTLHVARLTSSGKFRVVAELARPSYSAIRTELVTPRVLLRVHGSRVAGIVRLYGTVTPAETGAHLDFQLSQPVRPGNSQHGSERSERWVTQFSTVVRRYTKQSSRFSLVVKVLRAGSYRALVALPKGPLAPGASSEVELAAARKKNKR